MAPNGNSADRVLRGGLGGSRRLDREQPPPLSPRATGVVGDVPVVVPPDTPPRSPQGPFNAPPQLGEGGAQEYNAQPAHHSEGHDVPISSPGNDDLTSPVHSMGYRRMGRSRRGSSGEHRALSAAAQQEHVKMQLNMLIDRLRHLGIDMSGVSLKSGPLPKEPMSKHLWDAQLDLEAGYLSDEDDGTAAAIAEQKKEEEKKEEEKRKKRWRKRRRKGESMEEVQEYRPVRWLTTWMFIAVMTVMAAVIGFMIYQCVTKSLEDGRWYRTYQLATIPWTFLVLYFGVHIIISNLVCMLGPIAHTERNSQYYSAVRPPPYAGPDPLPDVTIQIPVYKESLEKTIVPTLKSIMAATKRYESEGGKANIVVYDDGLILISRPEQNERIRYYRQHGIAYVARPAENRRGRFKKASNLNFGMTLALRVKERMQHGKTHSEALRDLVEVENYSFKAAGNIQIGEFMLLIDSDTRVPEDCILPLVSEMKLNDRVAFIQNLTDPMQQVHDYWENAISHFTWSIYRIAITIASSGGDPAPLVGHNVLLRWSVMQEVAFIDPDDGKRKYWSENAVSEDFDYSMRLQSMGYIGRYAMYLEGFKEGVSLTVHDEMTRFKKYAYGASEMLFNPLYQWCYRGPFSPIMRRYMCTRQVPFAARMNILGYLGTYFAMAGAPFYVVINYFAYEYFPIYRNEVVKALDVAVLVLVVFSLFVPLSMCVIKHRLGMKWSVWGEFRHILVFTIFFSGLGYHLLVAIGSHLLGINMQFSITLKEIKKTNFFKEVRATLVGYWKLYLWCLLGWAIIVGLWIAPKPYGQIHDIHSWFPMAWTLFFHMFSPIFLNPILMMIRF